MSSGQNIAKTNGIAESGVKVDFDAVAWLGDLDGATVFAALLLASMSLWENSTATATVQLDTGEIFWVQEDMNEQTHRHI